MIKLFSSIALAVKKTADYLLDVGHVAIAEILGRSTQISNKCPHPFSDRLVKELCGYPKLSRRVRLTIIQHPFIASTPSPSSRNTRGPKNRPRPERDAHSTPPGMKVKG